ncbi:MAG: glycosyltransferase family 4 protein [Myxococcaceae bacterium]
MVRGPMHGIARYALELARRVPALAPDLSFFALTGPEGLPAGLGELRPDLPLERCAAGFLSPLEQPALALALVRSGCDLFHATSFSLPGVWPGRLVATLHDANHLALHTLYGPGRVAYYRMIVTPRARLARALITVSEFSRDELARHLFLSPYRLQVIPQGVAESFARPPESDIVDFQRRYALPSRYLAAVGSEKAHKNLAVLAKIAGSLPAPIAVLAGRGAARRFGFPSSTIDLGELPEHELPKFYAGAQALLFPSRYEGFGLPALEAMACGCPVVAAKAGALPEVVRESGLLVPPDDEGGWRDAALRLLRDESLRRELAARGTERACLFTWDDCARRTLAVYRRALG